MYQVNNYGILKGRNLTKDVLDNNSIIHIWDKQVKAKTLGTQTMNDINNRLWDLDKN